MKTTETHNNIPAFLRHTYPELRIRDGPGEAKINCPSHDDNEPSCSMNLTTGLWCCHACGTNGDLISFYRERHGVDFDTAHKELNNKQWRHPKLVQNKAPAALVAHPYLDDQGKIAYEVMRELDEQGNTQKIWQRRPNGKGGHINKLDDVPKTIYRRDEVEKAKEVLIAEGEKDVDRLRGNPPLFSGLQK